MTPQDLAQDLEAFERWGMVVEDELRAAVDAVIAFEDIDPEFVSERGELVGPDTPTSDAVDDLVNEIAAFKENPDRPAWFTPAFQMVLVVSTWVTFLADYVDEQKTQPANSARSRLLVEKVGPAVEHFGRWLDALQAAGYLRNDETGRTLPPRA